MKVFHSMPLRGLTEEQISKNRVWQHKAIENIVKSFFKQDCEILPTLINYAPGTAGPLWYFGEGIKTWLSQADLLCLAPDWREARGCRAEQFVAKEYGIPCIQLNSELSFDWISNKGE